ncbi:MAG: haloacid dehalogenase-like hydrolase [Bacteroidales bacterium]|nr:haloacid dehalogenase-like hydrolase [Bacteroidales bacterium]
MVKIWAFDFDGTIVQGDSLWLFLRHIEPNKTRRLAKLLKVSPWLCLGGLIKRYRSVAKEHLISAFVGGMDSARLAELCDSFSGIIDQHLNPEVMSVVSQALAQGDEVVIVSASLANWIHPWAEPRGIKVIATEMEDGAFVTPNCNGQEKCRRFLAQYPKRQSYHLIYYGDSSNDLPMLHLSDDPHLLSHNLH